MTIPLGWKAGIAAAALALAFAGGYAARGKPPAPAVALREDTASQKASASASDRKDEKGAARTTTTVEEFGTASPCAAEGSASAKTGAHRIDPPTVGNPTSPAVTRRTVTVEERGPEVITEHAAETTASAEQSHLSLTVTPALAPPGWAVGVALDDLPGARLLRLELDRRLFGNLWLTAGVVPARREVGLGLRMEW